jgi:hypothetical protein
MNIKDLQMHHPDSMIEEDSLAWSLDTYPSLLHDLLQQALPSAARRVDLDIIRITMDIHVKFPDIDSELRTIRTALDDIRFLVHIAQVPFNLGTNLFAALNLS